MGIINSVRNYGKIFLDELEKKRILADLEKSHSESRYNQRSIRKRWDVVEQFVEGRQIKEREANIFHDHMWGMQPSDTGSIDDEYMVSNDMLRIHLSNVQRLSSYQIEPDVLPNDKRDTEDVTAARIGRIALADHWQRQTNENAFKVKFAHITGLYGVSFLKTVLDPNLGNHVPVEKDATGAWNTSKLMPEGRMVTDVISPRNILLPRWSRDLAKADWIEEVHVESVDWVYRNYGVIVDSEMVKADDAVLIGSGFSVENKSERDTGVSMNKNLVLVKERYVRPCPKFPKGAIFVWVTQKLLRSSTLSDFYEDLPYDVATMIYDHRDIFGDGTLWHLVPEQRAINDTLTSVMRHVKTAGILQRLIPSGSNVKEADFTDETGRGLLYDGDKAPHYIEVPELPATNFNWLNILDQRIQSHGYAQDVSRRKGAISGNAIAALQEIDDTVLRPALNSMESALQNASVKVLKGIAKHYNNNRLARMTNRSGMQVETFRGDMLRGNFDASVKLMTGLPSNKTFRLEFLTKLATLKIISQDEFREFMEFGTEDSVKEALQKDFEVADNAVTQLKNIELYQQNPDRPEHPIPPFIVARFDNHQILRGKLVAAMREGYRDWDPGIQAAFDMNLDLCDHYLNPQPMPIDGQGGDISQTAAEEAMKAPVSAEVGTSVPDANAELNASRDSMQNPASQPDRTGMVEPGVTGMTVIPNEGV